MIDLFANVDFEPLYYDLDAAMAFLRQLPNTDSTEGEPVDFHMYWKSVRPFERKQILPIKSFIATQPYEQFRLTLWGTSDLTTSPLLQPWLKYINFKIYNPVTEARGTILEGQPFLNADDSMVYPGGDLFRALILHKHGGVYVDMDSVYLRDFRPLFGTEFLYKWSFQKDMISSAVMWLKQGSPLSLELLRGIAALPPGGTNWGCQNNMRAFSKMPFRQMPCAFFNPEWVVRFTPEMRQDPTTLEPFVVNKFTHEMYEGSFVWHWHNRWEHTVQPGCKFELLEAQVDDKLKKLGLL